MRRSGPRATARSLPGCSERYDRDLADLLGMQSELAETVTQAIAIQLTPTEATKLANRAPVNAEAHLEYLKARRLFFGGSPEAMDGALRHARRARELDPASALSWSVLANCLIFRAIRGMDPPAEATAAGVAAVERALAVGPPGA